MINLSINLNSQYNAIDIHAEQGINDEGMFGGIILGGMPEEMSRGKCPGGNVQGEMSGECPRVFRDNRVGLL